jgi:hypothetical protein
MRRPPDCSHEHDDHQRERELMAAVNRWRSGGLRAVNLFHHGRAGCCAGGGGANRSACAFQWSRDSP